MVETYERELSVPLQDMEKTYIELKVLCEKQKDKFENVDWTRIDERYNKAKEQLAKMLPFEEELQALDPKSHQERADVYGRYIDECKDVLNDQFIQIIHERMITDCCLSGEFTIENCCFFPKHNVFFFFSFMLASVHQTCP